MNSLIYLGAFALTFTLQAAKPLRGIDITPIGTYVSGLGAGAAEIAAYDPATHRLFVVNATAVSVDVLDISNPTTPAKVGQLSLSLFGGGANSVAVRNGIVAIAVEGIVRTEPGVLLFYDSNLNYLSSVAVGSLPDMVTFSHNGRWVLTANEGEPNSYGQPTSVDPLGTVSIIDLSGGAANVTQDDVRTLDFTAFNGMSLPGIRIFGPGASVAQDLEPENIAVSHDSKTAWVTLQENNAIATIDIVNGKVASLTSLGLKNHALPGFGLDPSDRDDAAGTGPAIKIGNWPVKGVYMPDGIASYEFKGQSFLVLANEGDARDYTGFGEEVRVGDAAYKLDPTIFPNAAILKQSRNLGRLRVTKASGDLDGDGFYDELHSFGGRSFSIRRADGSLVFDSGDQFEQALAQINPTFFNVSNNNNTFDSRSPNKGPEPEGITVGKAFGRIYAFIGLERMGGVMVYDITNPFEAEFVNYVNNRTFSNPFALATAGDLGPEGLVFINAEESPTGAPLLVTANEISGTTTIFRIDRE